jgi:hypothetical protein
LSHVYGVGWDVVSLSYRGTAAKSLYFFNFALSQLKRRLKAKRGKSFEFFEKTLKISQNPLTYPKYHGNIQI